jgi:transcriptional regulator with XRE-family HTH domain
MLRTIMSENSVTDEAAANDPVHGMGRRIAAYRTQRGLRVSDLARSVGVSPSLVSQIEHGQSRPSVSTLFAVAETLGLPVDAFFREQPDPASHVEPTVARAPSDPYLVRRAERVVIDIEGGVRWERLTPTPLRDVEFLELVYGPGAQSSPTLYRHPGTEMILILTGRLDIHIGFDRYHLTPGDSMQFSSALPHRYVNPTQETTRAVTTILRDGERHETRHLPPE